LSAIQRKEPKEKSPRLINLLKSTKNLFSCAAQAVSMVNKTYKNIIKSRLSAAEGQSLTNLFLDFLTQISQMRFI